MLPHSELFDTVGITPPEHLLLQSHSRWLGHVSECRNQFISHLCTTIIIKDNKNKIEHSDGLPEKQVCSSKLVD